MDGSTQDKPPAQPGYRWPAEWEPHQATWIAWPHNRDTWPGKFEPVPATFAKLVRTILEFEPVNVLAGGEAMQDAESHVGGLPNVTLFEIETNDAWVRDYGPTFLAAPAGQPPAFVNWQYNAWGGKYPPWDRDVAVGAKISQAIHYQRFSAGLILEGGAIEGDGFGTVLTTESCLLNPNRNAGATRQNLDRCLADFLGAKKVLWLTAGEIAGDDTDGHIDQLSRFVKPNTIVAAAEDDPNDENFQPLRDMHRQLREMSDQAGRPLDVVSLPMPRPLFWQGQRLPASYANFYIVNGAVIVPQFDDPADESAVGILDDLFSDRHIIGFPAVDLVLGLGSIHCLTQQQPKR